MKIRTLHLVSLGCAKNTVDSQSMAQLLDRTGYQSVGRSDQAEVIIVNTCGFIGPAKEESLNVIHSVLRLRMLPMMMVHLHSILIFFVIVLNTFGSVTILL